MTVSFLTSGFPDGFTDQFTNRLKRYYTHGGSMLFIASDFTGHAKTDKYASLFVDLFEEKGIRFERVEIIDSRTPKDTAIHLVQRADVIWISGGDTLKQMAAIYEYGLVPYLQNRNGITIGMSAGSINMAKNVVLPRDVEDNIPVLSTYDGIGLVDINIEPHIDLDREEHIEDIYEAAQYTTIYGLFDNSFIEVVEGKTEFFGPYLKFESAAKGREQHSDFIRQNN